MATPTIATPTPTLATPTFLELEITARCQLTCEAHCYAQAGPTRGHGSMTDQDWRGVISEAATLGVRTVQLIGGEPTMHPAFTDLVRHALDAGLTVQVYSNLYRVRAGHWDLYADPRVSLGTSYYSDDPGEHDAITGRGGSHAATRRHIMTAVRLGIPLKVGIIHMRPGQRSEQAAAEMKRLGVRRVHLDRVREVGNAAQGSTLPSSSALCGRCADGKAAVLPDGTVTPAPSAGSSPPATSRTAAWPRSLPETSGRGSPPASPAGARREAAHRTRTPAPPPRASTAPRRHATPTRTVRTARRPRRKPATRRTERMRHVDWQQHAEALAHEVAHPISRWHGPLATTPRHPFMPRWWNRTGADWELCDGPADQTEWVRAAYSNRSRVTRIGALHADDAEPGATVQGKPTSSSTLPGLVVQMYRHAMLTDTCDVLVTTGSGYGTALACRRLDHRQVTSVDVDPHLVELAACRLDSLGLRPQTAVCDLTGPLPWEGDRIVSTVSVRTVPASWLTALRPGGRLVTSIADTALVVTADKTADGGAVGRVEPDAASFMRTRTGADYPPGLTDRLHEIRDRDDGEVSTGRYPVLDVREAWDVWSMLTLAVPGIEHHYEGGPDRQRTALMFHADGSWARAVGHFTDPPTVHQGGPQRLWDEMERVRSRLNTEGGLPVYGAHARIDPDGSIHLRKGKWTAQVLP